MNKNKAFFNAIQQGVLSQLKTAFSQIRSGRKVNWQLVVQQPSLDTALHVSARTNHKHIFRFLLQNGFDVCLEQQNKDGKRPLHEAAQNCRVFAVEELLRAGVSVDPLNRSCWTPLMLAVTKDVPESEAVVRLLLSGGSDVRLTNKDGWTAVHVCCRNGSPASLEALLEGGGCCSSVSRNGRTPLHTAALHGRSALLLALHRYLSSGASTTSTTPVTGADTFTSLTCTTSPADVSDACGSTPLMDCMRGGFMVTAQELLRLWPAVQTDAKDALGRGCVQLAAEAGQEAAVKFLVNELHLDPKERDNIGQCSLHSAAREGHCDVVQMLAKDMGCDVNDRDNNGRTALWCARANRRPECAALLLQLGADEVDVSTEASNP